MPQAAIAVTADPVPQLLPEIDEKVSVRGKEFGSGHIAAVAGPEGEDTALRRVVLRNMRLLKREVLPLLAVARHARQRGDRDGSVPDACQGDLLRITREVLGLIDDTVIHSTLHRVTDSVEPCDLGRIAQRVIAADRGEIRLSRAHIRIGRLPVLRVREPLTAMLFEELFVTAVRHANAGAVPEISVSGTEDPQGNPIVLMTGAGIPLSARKQVVAGQGARGPVWQEPHAWSLCHRLAERAGGSFEIFETETGTALVSIRFPKHLVVSECRYAPEA